MVLVKRQPDTLAVADGEEGHLPFHFAVNWGANLDIIFCLLNSCPSALLSNGGNAAAAFVAAGAPHPSVEAEDAKKKAITTTTTTTTAENFGQ
jgi:hypothetical protein